MSFRNTTPLIRSAAAVSRASRRLGHNTNNNIPGLAVGCYGHGARRLHLWLKNGPNDAESFFRHFERDFRPFFENSSKAANKTSAGRRPQNLRLSPEINVAEGKQSFVIEAELPGVRKEHIKVEVKDNNLIIKGEKPFELKEGEEIQYRTVERSFGTYERSFELPEGVDISKVQAKHVDGVLKVEIPKLPKQEPKEISISIN